jgi:hypothetical protein
VRLAIPLGARLAAPLVLALAGAAAPAPAAAQTSSSSTPSPAACEVARPLEGQRLLRRLSLDLRGRVPTHDEQAVQSGKAEVSDATVDAYLASADFVDTMRSYHAGLLWPSINSVEFDGLQHKLFPVEIAPGVTVYYSVLRALFLRSVTVQFPPCRNEPVQYDAAGRIRMFPLMQGGQIVAMQEGYVEVEPYWAPGTRIKVCALDAQSEVSGPACTAQATAQSPFLKQTCDQFGTYTQFGGFAISGSAIQCSGAFSFLSDRCGCGPNLRLCNTQETQALIRASLVEQQMRLLDQIVAENLPYTEVLLTKRSSVNGYLAHYLNYQSTLSFDVFGEKDATSPVPAGLGWPNGNAWVDVTRTGRHAGVLTTPGYLLKYQSNRGRAHRFYNAFECAAFIPSGPLPSPSEACSKHEDLTQRCGCNACHVALEPMAANWGRFAEYGLTPLDEGRYPTRYEAVCTNMTTIDQLFRCFRFYQLEAVGDELPFKNLLRPYVFRTPDQVATLEAGPAALAGESIASGKFATCTVRKLWTPFRRRPPPADAAPTVIPDLRGRFQADQHRLRGLVKNIVLNPAYRRMP